METEFGGSCTRANNYGFREGKPCILVKINKVTCEEFLCLSIFGQLLFALCHQTVVSCLSVLSVTLVHCGQTVGWIKMKLGTQVGLSPGHIVLDGDPAPPPPKEQSPEFSAHICRGQMAGLRYDLVWR